MHTVRLPVTGVGVDLGGQWVGPDQPHVMALIRELGLEVYPTHDEGQNLAHLLGQTLRYRGLIPPLPPHVLADYALLSKRFEALSRRIPPEAPGRPRTRGPSTRRPSTPGSTETRAPRRRAP